MKKILYIFILLALLIPMTSIATEASIISDRTYRAELNRENRRAVKEIKELFNKHNKFANEHNLSGLKTLYSDNYINNDGFTKDVYFKSIDETWEECKDLTYTTEIDTITVNGDYASVQVFESANGTINDTLQSTSISGEIHSNSTGIYHLVKINERWFISGENALTDESSLLYGDARFMNIEIQAPDVVSAGETYTTTLKVVNNDDSNKTFIIGSIDHDPVTYPATTPKSELRALPQTQILERLIKANSDNLNEYAVASLAISKVAELDNDNFQLYMAGLACVMKRVNVIPKNNFAKLEEQNENINR